MVNYQEREKRMPRIKSGDVSPAAGPCQGRVEAEMKLQVLPVTWRLTFEITA